ncbi:hypothetical protein RAA17_13665 [Komagataeibacter rhaeticus]|nr:hypothetical protein [Komagataeibacter rhaeticus]
MIEGDGGAESGEAAQSGLRAGRCRCSGTERVPILSELPAAVQFARPAPP